MLLNFWLPGPPLGQLDNGPIGMGVQSEMTARVLGTDQLSSAFWENGEVGNKTKFVMVVRFLRSGESVGNKALSFHWEGVARDGDVGFSAGLRGKAMVTGRGKSAV